VAFLIDTNIAIRLRDGDEVVMQKLDEHRGRVLLSVLSLVELERGIHKSSANAVARQLRLDSILRHIPVLAFDRAAARAYGLILGQIGWSKRREFDRMIAAHAIATASILVTNNIADFRDIPGPQLEDWT
jgi:tRNA(fMet)-specific endonuclease VapC